MKYLISKSCIVFIFMLIITAASASSGYAKAYQRLYTGVRPIGMGGAFAAVADDRNTVFYNPAGLSRIDGFTLGVFNPAVGVGENGFDMYSDSEDIDMDDTGEVADLLRDYTGEHMHLYAALTPHLGFRINNFGVMVSAFGIGSMDSTVRNPVYPQFNMNARIDIGGIGGVGFMVPGVKGLRAGAAFKSISRESINEVYTPAQIAADDFEDRIEDDKKSGTATGLDLGFIYTLPWNKYFETDVALTGQNIPELEFDDGETLETEWTAGVALKKEIGPFAVLAALDYRDITDNIEEDSDLGKRIHMGTEVQFKDLFAVRAGFNQGYPTLGASLDLWVIKFDAAMYSEEVGAYAGQREDKRYMGQLTIGW